MTQLIVALIGAVLCFAGAASIHLAVLLAGFAVCFTLADSLGSGLGVALIIGAAGALAAGVLVTLVLKAGLFFVGAIIGAVIGVKLYTLLQAEQRSIVVAIVFAAAVGFVGGVLADRLRVRMLVILTALGGAGLILHGLGSFGGSWDPLRFPDTGAEQLLAIALWLALAAAGWFVQQRFSASALERDRKQSGQQRRVL